MSENNRQDTGREACSQKLCPELRHFLLRILCSNLVGISPRQLEDAHRATSRIGRIAAHPATDRWQDPRRSSSPLPDEVAARRIVVQPRRANPTSRVLNLAAVHVDSNHDEPRESRRPDDVRRNVRAARTAARQI